MIVIKRRKKEKRKTKSFSTKNWYCIALSVPNFGIETSKPSFAVFPSISEVTYNYIN